MFYISNATLLLYSIDEINVMLNNKSRLIIIKELHLNIGYAYRKDDLNNVIE